MSLDWKTIEGQRVQAVLGAVGALPAAALVFSDNADVVAPGGPLFLAAVVLVLGAYMHWLYTDAIYHLDGIEYALPPEMLEERIAWSKTLEKPGYRFQWSTYAYAAASMMCTVAGFAAIHSTIRFPVSVGAGFVAVGGLLIAALCELIKSRAVLNGFTDQSRTMSERAWRLMNPHLQGSPGA